MERKTKTGSQKEESERKAIKKIKKNRKEKVDDETESLGLFSH